MERQEAEVGLPRPHLETMPGNVPDLLPLWRTRAGAVPEDPREVLQEAGNLQTLAPTDGRDGELALAPQNRKRKAPLLAAERHLEETHLHRTPPTTQASLAAKLQTRPMPTKSRG